MVIFNDRLVDVVEKYLKKGAKVYIEGALQTRKWTDNSGQERYTTEVVLQRFRGELTMLDGRSGGGGAAPAPVAMAKRRRPRISPPRAAAAARRPRAERRAPVQELDDEIPF